MAQTRSSGSEKDKYPLTTDPKKRAKANKFAAAVKGTLPPGLAQPALRALARAGYTKLGDFTKINVEDLEKLHGMGPKAIETIRNALKSKGQSFRQ